MTTTVISRLHSIRQYLADEILPDLPGEKRSDFRAALKILETMEIEIDFLPGLLETEVHDMFRLCDAALAALGRPELADKNLRTYNELTRRSAASIRQLSEKQDLHADLTNLVGQFAVQLRAKVEAEPQGLNCPSGSKVVLIKCQQFLRRQARARLGWQAVFPAATFYHETANAYDNEGDAA
ncbi:MAG: hypothetical protein IPP45_16455 [Sphingomonadales bacterium]|nr:hypothetical protein [Sphingomonadales bacterium]